MTEDSSYLASDQSKPSRISLGQTDHFDHEGFSGDIYVPKNARRGFIALKVSVHGRHARKRILEGNTRAYFVAEGQGTFTINSKSYAISPGDLYVIPAGGEYEYEGQMTLFEFNVSPDNSFGDEKLE